MSRADPQLKIRLPQKLRDRITQSAEDNRRSVNAEILAALDSMYPEDTNIFDVLDVIDFTIETMRGYPSKDLGKLQEALWEASSTLKQKIDKEQFDRYFDQKWADEGVRLPPEPKPRRITRKS